MKKILLIEKDPKKAKSLSKKLEAENFEVVGIADSLSAFKAAHIEDPDLIVVDLDMPGLNGFKLAEIFREDDLLRDTPLLAIADKNEEVNRSKIIEAGFSDVETRSNDVVAKALKLAC